MAQSGMMDATFDVGNAVGDNSSISSLNTNSLEAGANPLQDNPVPGPDQAKRKRLTGTGRDLQNDSLIGADVTAAPTTSVGDSCGRSAGPVVCIPICCPAFILNSPTWVKMVIALSVALLAAALVMLGAFAVPTASRANREGYDRDFAGSGFTGFPSIAVSDAPAQGPTETKSPTIGISSRTPSVFTIAPSLPSGLSPATQETLMPKPIQSVGTPSSTPPPSSTRPPPKPPTDPPPTPNSPAPPTPVYSPTKPNEPVQAPTIQSPPAVRPTRPAPTPPAGRPPTTNTPSPTIQSPPAVRPTRPAPKPPTGPPPTPNLPGPPTPVDSPTKPNEPPTPNTPGPPTPVDSPTKLNEPVRAPAIQSPPSPKPTLAQEPGSTPKPTLAQEPGSTPKPTLAQEPGSTPKPTLAQKPGSTPKPTDSQKPVSTPKPPTQQPPGQSSSPVSDEMPVMAPVPPGAPPIQDESPFPTSRPTVLTPRSPTTAPMNKPTTQLPLNPTSGVTDEPTPAPTKTPTTSPTSYPTPEPARSPTRSPTRNPTPKPTRSPTRAPTPNPTSTPTRAPTRPPTSNPTLGPDTVMFYVVAGRPEDGELAETVAGLPDLPNGGGLAFTIHLGGWNDPQVSQCDQEAYSEIFLRWQLSSVPVYFLPGDAEWIFCPDQEEANNLWKELFLNFETTAWADQGYGKVRDVSQEENFAFIARGVLCVGINLVGGERDDNEENFIRRWEAGLDWIHDTFLQASDNSIHTMVVFAHAGPNVSSNDAFYSALNSRIAGTYAPSLDHFVLVSRNEEGQTWGTESNYLGMSNAIRAWVWADVWPPLKVVIEEGEFPSFVQGDGQDLWIRPGLL